MNKFVTENLLLMEFLVDDLTLSQQVNKVSMENETLVAFEFLDNAPLMVGEDEFKPPNDSANIKCGKSCLFALTPEQGNFAFNQFDITIRVYKKFCKGVLPEMVLIGEGILAIVEVFRQLMNKALCCKAQTCAESVTDTITLMNVCGDIIGEITVFIRMSCFGKYIVTQFQMDLSDRTINFKQDKSKNMIFQGEQICPPCPGPYGEANNLIWPHLTSIESCDPPQYANDNVCDNAPTAQSPYEQPTFTQLQKSYSKYKQLERSPSKVKSLPVCDSKKDCVLVRLGKCNKNTGRGNLEMKFQTPKGLPVKPRPQYVSIDSMYDFRDFPEGYLESYYGKDKWLSMLKEQLAEERRLAAIFGSYKVGGSKHGKHGESGGKHGASGGKRGTSAGKQGASAGKQGASAGKHGESGGKYGESTGKNSESAEKHDDKDGIFNNSGKKGKIEDVSNKGKKGKQKSDKENNKFKERNRGGGGAAAIFMDKTEIEPCTPCLPCPICAQSAPCSSCCKPYCTSYCTSFCN